MIELLPRERCDLMAGIGPVIGVVKIKKQPESERLCLFSLGKGVGQIVGQGRWRVEQPQPNPAITVTAKNLKPGAGRSSVAEDRSIRLSLGQERNIHPQREARARSRCRLLR